MKDEIKGCVRIFRVRFQLKIFSLKNQDLYYVFLIGNRNDFNLDDIIYPFIDFITYRSP